VHGHARHPQAGIHTLTSTFTGAFRDTPEEQVRFMMMVREGKGARRAFPSIHGHGQVVTHFPHRHADKAALEEGTAFTPRFDANGLVTAVVTDADDGTLLMVAHMNAEALAFTLDTGIAHYWSRSRRELWKKGETSGNVQHVVEIRTDCDQDAALAQGTRGRRQCNLPHRPALLLLPRWKPESWRRLETSDPAESTFGARLKESGRHWTRPVHEILTLCAASRAGTRRG
jgi:phosphoribosyl-AMP cyclohydrolase